METHYEKVLKKVSKNMSAEEIADMLEEDIDLIVRIYNTLKKHPDWNDEKVYESLSF